MELVKKGKKIVIIIIMVLIMIDIITIGGCANLYAINGQINEVIAQLIRGTVRLVLEGVILFFLYKGHRWAKYLMTTLLITGAFFGFAIMTSMHLKLFDIYFLIIAVIDIALAITLIVSKSVKSFLSFQKNGFIE